MSDVIDWGDPALPDNSDGGQWYTLGTVFQVSVTGNVPGIRWRCSTNSPSGQIRYVLYEVGNSTPLADTGLFTPVNGVDNDRAFPAPVSVTPGVDYIACVVTDRYTATPTYGWPAVSTPGGYVTAAAGTGATANGRLQTTTAGVAAYPSIASGNQASYHVGPQFVADTVALVTLTPTLIGLNAQPVTPVPGAVTVPLTPTPIGLNPQPVTPVPGAVTVPLTPTPIGLNPQPVTPIPGAVTVPLTPTLIGLRPMALPPPASVALTPVRIGLHPVPLTPVPITTNPKLAALSWAIAKLLRDCLCAKLLDTLAGAVCRCSLMAGDTTIADICEQTPDGNGQAWVRILRIFSTREFPRPAVDLFSCAGSLWAIEIELGVLRCAVTSDDEGQPPSADELNLETAVVLDDAYALRFAAECCLPASIPVIPGEWQPMSGGGCTGGRVTTMIELVPGPITGLTPGA